MCEVPAIAQLLYQFTNHFYQFTTFFNQNYACDGLLRQLALKI